MTPEELNERLEHLYHSAEAASSEGLVDEALKRCEAALEILDLNFDEECSYSHTDFLMLAGNSCWEDSDLEGALRYYRQSHESDPGRLDSMVAMGVCLFHLCRFTSAKQILEVVSAEDPDIGEVWYYLALIALREDRNPVAEIFFQRANEKESQRWLVPKFLSTEEIAKIIEQILRSLPREIAAVLNNVAIIVEEMPTEETLHSSDPPIDPLVLGLFEGIPFPDESGINAPTAITRILIYSSNIALIARDHDRLIEELEVTVKHEIGHYLGLDEDDLAARGLD